MESRLDINQTLTHVVEVIIVSCKKYGIFFHIQNQDKYKIFSPWSLMNSIIATLIFLIRKKLLQIKSLPAKRLFHDFYIKMVCVGCSRSRTQKHHCVLTNNQSESLSFSSRRCVFIFAISILNWIKGNFRFFLPYLFPLNKGIVYCIVLYIHLF